MSRQRELLVNIERMRREMDEFFGDAWPRTGAPARRSEDFVPRVDVYYVEPTEGEGPKAVVRAELAGVDPDAVNLEISGRVLAISGTRPIPRTEGRAYQQLEIPTGRFRRRVELGVEVEAADAKATFEDGMLKIELPLRTADRGARRVPIERVD